MPFITHPSDTRSTNQRITFDAQSWALVHYLLLGNRQTAPLSLVPAYRPLPLDLDPILRDYVAKGEFPELSIPLTPFRPLPSTPSFIPESRSLAERAQMLVFGPRPRAGLSLAQRALDSDPREGAAMEVIGTYYFLQNQPGSARTWLSRAFDNGSAAPATAIYLALLAPSISDRERYLSAAITAQPDNELAWQRLFEIYRADGRLDLVTRFCTRTGPAPLAFVRLSAPDCHR